MRIAFITPGGQILDPLASELKSKGVEVLVNECDVFCDFIFLSTVSVVDICSKLVDAYPHIPIVVYNWDQYAWHKNQSYSWSCFDELQNRCVEIWTPSNAVNLRIQEFLNLGHKCYVVKSFARLFNYPTEQIKDGRYVFQVVRDYVDDPCFGWAEQACKELGITLYMNNYHHRAEKDFQKLIAEATLLFCHYDEASTGGLTLIEGHNLGKPVLVSNSPYMGAIDYFGNRANYFERGSYEDFKQKLENLFYNPPTYELSECREFAKQFTVDNMAQRMVDRFNYLKNEQK